MDRTFVTPCHLYPFDARETMYLVLKGVHVTKRLSRYYQGTFVLFLGVSTLLSQTVAPPQGDPTVFYMFLRFQDSLVQDGNALAKTNPTAAAASLSLSVGDFLKINPVYQQLASALLVIDTKANAYRDQVVSGKIPLDVGVIQGFTTSRNRAITQARAQLQNALTPGGWQALSAYIEGPFRQTIQVTRGRP
jgi:hypothetical protein